MNEYERKAIQALTELLNDENPGMRLEAARELLKFAAATL